MPCQIRWDRADRLAQLHQGLRVVNAEARVQLQRDLVDAVRLGERDEVLPVVDEHLPLVLEDLAEVIRPRAGDPVRILRGLAVAGAAGEAVDLVQAVFFRHEDRVAHVLVVRRGELLVRVNRVAVAGERADLHVILLDDIAEFLELCLVVQQDLRVAVVLAREAAAADFDHLDAHGLEVLQGLFKRHVADDVGKYA